MAHRAGETMLVLADDVVAVRHALAETQDDFAKRFSRERKAVSRWEQQGVRLKYNSCRWQRWQRAVSRAIDLSEKRGLPDEATEHLRTLRILP